MSHLLYSQKQRHIGLPLNVLLCAMSYRADVTAYIWNEHRTAYIRGNSELDLPFVPVAGMKLQFRDMSDVLQLVEVVWRVENQDFFCKAEPDCVCVFELDEPIEELAELLDPVRDLRRLGWSGLDRVWRGQ